MNEWLTNLLVAVILLCVWLLAVLYYLSKMDRKNEEIKQACTERVIGRVDRMASLLINEGLKPYGQPLKMKYRNSFTYQRNMFYRYSYKGKEYWGMDGRRITSFFSTGKNGTPIELYCNPSRPSQFYCPAEERNMTAAKVVNVSLVTVFAAVIWIAILVERK